METQVTNESMREVAIRILEEWGMMLVEPDGDAADGFDPTAPCYIASLTFDGVVSGEYAVICQERFARALSNNLLAEDDCHQTDNLEDAVKELVNVLSGNLLTTTYGTETAFALSAPTIRHTTLHEASVLFNNSSLCYRADGEPVRIVFKPSRQP